MASFPLPLAQWAGEEGRSPTRHIRVGGGPVRHAPPTPTLEICCDGEEESIPVNPYRFPRDGR